MRKLIAILGSVMVVALAAFAWHQYIRANQAMAEARANLMRAENERQVARALVQVRSERERSSRDSSPRPAVERRLEVDPFGPSNAPAAVVETDIAVDEFAPADTSKRSPRRSSRSTSSSATVALDDEEEVEDVVIEMKKPRSSPADDEVLDRRPPGDPADENLKRELSDLNRRFKTVLEAALTLNEAGEEESARSLNSKARALKVMIQEREAALRFRQEKRAADEGRKGGAKARKRGADEAQTDGERRAVLQVLQEVRALREDVAAIRKEIAELRGGMPGAQGDHHGGYIVMESITRDGKQIVVPRWVELGPPKRKAEPDDSSPVDFEPFKRTPPVPIGPAPAHPTPAPLDQPTDDETPAKPTPDPADVPLLEKEPKPGWKTDPNSTAPVESSKPSAESSPTVPATAPPAPTDRDPTTLNAHPGAPTLGLPLVPPPGYVSPDPTKSAYDEAGARIVLTKENDKGQLVLLAPSRADDPDRKSKTFNWALDSKLPVDDLIKFLKATSQEFGFNPRDARLLLVVDDSYSQEEVAKFISAVGTAGFAPIRAVGIVSRLKVMLSQLPDGPRATVVALLRLFDNGTEGLRESIEFDGSTSLFGNFMSQRSSYYSHYGMDPKKVFVDLLVEENFSQEEYAKVLEAVKAAGFKKITRKVEAGTENPKLRPGSGLTVRIPAMAPDPVSFDSPFASPVPTEPNVAASTATDSPQAAVATSKWFAPESACRLVVQIDGTNANVSFQSPPREGNRQIRNSTSSGPELEIGGVSALLKASLDEWHVNAKETGILVVVDEEMSQEQLGKIIAAAGEFGPTRGGWLPQALKLMASQQVDEATKKVSTTVTLVSFQRNLEKGREGILETAEESGPIEDVGKILTKFVERYQGMEPDLKKSAVVTLQVDKSLPQHHVVQLVDAAQKAGFKSIVVKAVEPETDAPPKPEPTNVQY